MEPPTYILDPDYDTIITLTNPNKEFAPWDSDKKSQSNAVLADSNIDGSKAETLDPTTFDKAHQDNNLEGERARALRFHVSSRHLILASSWFRHALAKGNWSESDRCASDEKYHVSAQDWDEQAFLTLLNILHLRNKQVPRQVSLEMLAKIAVLVDYYDCDEAVEPFTTMWIDKLALTLIMPSILDRDLVLWIWITWTFNVPRQFELATQVAIAHHTDAMVTLGLTIPESLCGKRSSSLIKRVEQDKNASLGAIDSSRNQTLTYMVEFLHELLALYQSDAYKCKSNDCSFTCGSALLGALTKQLDAWSIFSPRPQTPHVGLSVQTLYNNVKEIKSPCWKNESASLGHFSNMSTCSLSRAVRPMLRADTVTPKGFLIRKLRAP